MGQSGQKGMGSRKHYKSGTPGHNRDMQQLARTINRERAQQERVRKSRRNRMYESVEELMRKKSR